MTIFFDLDGCLASLYTVTNWLEKLRAFDPSPYAEAAVMHNMSLLARYLNKLHTMGYQLGVISWLSRESTPAYDEAVTAAKLAWLAQHLKSVSWDVVHIVEYGTPKQNFLCSENDILFDDEARNRDNWTGEAYEPNEIFEVLKELIREG